MLAHGITGVDLHVFCHTRACRLPDPPCCAFPNNRTLQQTFCRHKFNVTGAFSHAIARW